MIVTATLDGHPVLSLRVELRRGKEPSAFEAVLPPGTVLHTGPCVLELRDGRTSRNLRQFDLETTGYTGDGRLVATGRDRRRDWDRAAKAPRGETTSQQFLDALFRSVGLEGDAPRLPGGLSAAPPVREGSLAQMVESLLRFHGYTFSIDDDGNVALIPTDSSPVIDPSTVVESLAGVADAPSEVRVRCGGPIEILELSQWRPVLPLDDGLRDLREVLAEWGIREHDARQACMSDGGFDALLPRTGTQAAERLALLKRYAWRLFQADTPGPWLPVGGVSTDGTLLPPVLHAKVTRAGGIAPEQPGGRVFTALETIPVEEFEIDTGRATVYLPRPPFALDGADDDPTLQSRRIIGEPLISLRIAREADAPPHEFVLPGGGEAAPVVIQAPYLTPVLVDGEVANGAMLDDRARGLATAFLATLGTREIVAAGVVSAPAGGTCERIVIRADENGLVSRVYESPAPMPELSALPPSSGAAGGPVGPVPSGLYQPINAFRAGPLVIRTTEDTPEGEAVVAMQAVHRDRHTSALTLESPGPLAFPFFLASEDAARFGRWFFVAGVEVAAGGTLRVLGPDDRHGEIAAGELFTARHSAPQGLRGVIVSDGDGPVFVDSGPLVSDARGRQPGASSSLVYDLDGSSLSGRRRGGLQFLTVLALSPAHRDEGARDGGWTPVLNLREGETAGPETSGRGLFAEGNGRDLGRLTAKLQGGPVLGDGAACTKHLYGATGDDDGLYRETAGHISTDAFFKIPGDNVHDAPLKFYPAPFAGGVPPWPPYEAQLKYDGAERHAWNRTSREGRWKIQYRVPFLPAIPPTWDPPVGPPAEPPVDDPPSPLYVPHEIRPAVSEYELWAPSHDWVPAPGARGGGAVPFPGPSIKSEGWAGEVNGVPDPTLGGGCIYLPPGVSMPDAQSDDGTRRHYVVLHPQVLLAFGHPDFANGSVHSGWAVALAGGNLKLTPRDADSATPGGMSQGVHITGHLSVGPDGTEFSDTQALRLGGGDNEGIAFGDDVQLYRDAEATLRTDADLEVGGKLTVEGLIDPTGLELEPQNANPGGTPAHTLWIDSNDNRLRVGSEVLAYASQLIADKSVQVLGFTGSGTTGKTVTLTGINRAHALLIFRDDGATEGCVLSLPMGATGNLRDRNLGDGSSQIVLNLDAPGSGPQTLTINSTAGSRNASGVAYKLLAIGTP